MVNTKLTEADLEALGKQDHLTLCRGWNILNTWRWPEWLPDEEKPLDPWTHDTRRGAAMDWINERIPAKELLRVWNTDEVFACPGQPPRMTNEEFELWWRGNHGSSS